MESGRNSVEVTMADDCGTDPMSVNWDESPTWCCAEHQVEAGRGPDVRLWALLGEEA